MNLPEIIQLLEEGGERTLLSASVGNELIVVLNALRKMEVQDYEAVWSDLKLVLQKTDKTRTNGSTSGDSAFARFQVIGEHKSYLTAYKLVKSVPDETTVYRILKPENLIVEYFDSASRIIAGYDHEPIGDPPIERSLLARREYYIYSPNGAELDAVKNPWNRRTVTFTDPAYLEITGANGTGNRVFNQSIEPPYSGVTGPTSIITAQYWDDVLFTVRETPDPIHHPEIFNTYPINWMDTNRDSRRWMDDFFPQRVCFVNDDGTTQSGFILVRASNAYNVT